MGCDSHPPELGSNIAPDLHAGDDVHKPVLESKVVPAGHEE